MAEALVATEFYGEVVWLGAVFKKAAVLWSDPVEAVDLGFAGLEGTRHFGETRKSCNRVRAQYPVGTEIRNVRQLSVLSGEELDAMAAAMGIDAMDPARLGATLVLRGIPDFTHVPPASRPQAESGATLTVDMENKPCPQPGRSLEVVHPGKGKAFKPAAVDRRGVTAWVERPGRLRIGDRMRLHVPAQRAWAPEACQT